MYTLPLLVALLPLAAHATGLDEQVTLQTPSAQALKCNNFKSYTALGDSYAAGVGSERRLCECNGDTATCTTEKCDKNTGSYGYQFWKKYGIESFQYQACSGANTTVVNNTQVNVSGFGTPDLVTINVGGDDGNLFEGVVYHCAYIYDYDSCQAALKNATSIIHNDLPARLKSLFASIKAKTASKPATVVVMSYAHFWPEKESSWVCLWPASSDQNRRMDALVRSMNVVLKHAASKAGFLFADVDAAFKTHRFCDSGDRWFNEAPFEWIDVCDDLYWEWGMFHPKFAGQSGGYLATLEKVLGC